MISLNWERGKIKIPINTNTTKEQQEHQGGSLWLRKRTRGHFRHSVDHWGCQMRMGVQTVRSTVIHEQARTLGHLPGSKSSFICKKCCQGWLHFGDVHLVPGRWHEGASGDGVCSILWTECWSHGCIQSVCLWFCTFVAIYYTPRKHPSFTTPRHQRHPPMTLSSSVKTVKTPSWNGCWGNQWWSLHSTEPSALFREGDSQWQEGDNADEDVSTDEKENASESDGGTRGTTGRLQVYSFTVPRMYGMHISS